MNRHIREHLRHILWNTESPSFQIGIRLRHFCKRNRTPRTDSKPDHLMVSGCLHKPSDILINRIMHIDLFHFRAHLKKHLRSDYRLDRICRIPFLTALYDLNLCLDIRIAHGNTDHEPVQL